MKAGGWILLWLCLQINGWADSARLPVFLADNHAESLAWITRHFDLDQPHTLVLVDAHTDATAAERSEEMREKLRRVASLEERAEKIEAWRQSGRLQAYNWIEPIMPRPVERVMWVPKPRLTKEEAKTMTAEAEAALDGRLEIEPRSAGEFKGRWRTLSLEALEQWEPTEKQRVILSIDLDFFTGLPVEEQERLLERVWCRAMDWPGLLGVSFAVSRPWLKDDVEAENLVYLASSLVARTRSAELEVEVGPDAGIDDSKRAKELGGKVPRWEAKAAPAKWKALLVNMGDALRMVDRHQKWSGELVEMGAYLAADGGEMDCDGVWRFEANASPVLRVKGVMQGTGRVRWYELKAVRNAYDFLPQTGLGKAFSETPGRWIYETRQFLGETADFALEARMWSKHGPGQVRIEAEVETEFGWMPLAAMEIRLAEGSGFRRGLSECMRMPYGFGIALEAKGDLSGVELGWAADCSNILIYAWRRAGVQMAWGDPGQLRAQLQTLAEKVNIESKISLMPEQLETGVILDFGQHVAALWADVEPVGILSGNDLVFHHLGGIPEIVKLAELAKSRPSFSVRTLPNAKASVSIKLAGDVVLADENRVVVEGFEKASESLFLTNLEGVPSMRAMEKQKPYDFRFPPERLTWLRERGVDAVSLANNHAGDAGEMGLMEGLDALKVAGIGIFGAGKNQEEACRAWLWQGGTETIAVFGVSIVDGLIAAEDSPGIAHLPTHERLLEQKMRAAQAKGASIVVLLHGGDEYQKEVNEEQRRWVRWLSYRGARIIAGAHPHVIQRSEVHGGTRIIYSLGNAVYPKNLNQKASGKVENYILGD